MWPCTANLRRRVNILQWTHLQLVSFAIAPVVLLIVHLLKIRSGGAIANESTVMQSVLRPRRDVTNLERRQVRGQRRRPGRVWYTVSNNL